MFYYYFELWRAVRVSVLVDSIESQLLNGLHDHKGPFIAFEQHSLLVGARHRSYS
jgi:hypothetical protein